MNLQNSSKLFAEWYSDVLSECEACSVAELGLEVLKMDGIEDWSVSEMLSLHLVGPAGTLLETVTVTLPSPFLST